MKKKNELFGQPIHKYIELSVLGLNNLLKKAGFTRAKALCRREEESPNCRFSCVAEFDTIPFKQTAGEAMGIDIKQISWVSDDAVGIIFN